MGQNDELCCDKEVLVYSVSQCRKFMANVLWQRIEKKHFLSFSSEERGRNIDQRFRLKTEKKFGSAYIYAMHNRLPARFRQRMI